MMFVNPKDRAFRKAYAEYLAKENPTWSQSSVSTHVSDSFYIYNNNLVDDFWSCIENEKTMKDAYNVIFNFIKNKPNLDKEVQRTEWYYKELCRLKAFVDLHYKGNVQRGFDQNKKDFKSVTAEQVNKIEEPKSTGHTTFVKNLKDLWECNSHETWKAQEAHYWDKISPTHMQVEREFDSLDWLVVEKMNAREFYDFLYDKYFFWKYTQPNRLVTTRQNLRKHLLNLEELENIKKQIFNFDRSDYLKGLKIAEQIHGLGFAGASGLLAVLFPENFGTVDQFVCKNLIAFGVLHTTDKPDSLSYKTSVNMIKLLQEKAAELNRVNNIDYWTPRKIDKVLWAYGR